MREQARQKFSVQIWEAAAKAERKSEVVRMFISCSFNIFVDELMERTRGFIGACRCWKSRDGAKEREGGAGKLAKRKCGHGNLI